MNDIITKLQIMTENAEHNAIIQHKEGNTQQAECSTDTAKKCKQAIKALES